MKKQFLFLLIAILFSTLSFSQVETTDDHVFMRTQDIKDKLGLSIPQTQKVEEIIHDFSEAAKLLIKEGKEGDNSFGKEYTALKIERNKALEKVLDEDQMVLFRIIDVGQESEVADYYGSLVASLSNQPEFIEELAFYQQNVKAPVILERKGSLAKKISTKDSLELLYLGEKFNEILVIGLEQAHLQNQSFAAKSLKDLSKSATKVNGEYKAVWKRIRKLRRKYNKPIEAEFKKLDTYTTEWNKDIKDILLKYIPAEEKESLDQLFFVLTQYGISRKINQFSFLLFDENNVNNFFQITENAQELFFVSP